MDPERTFGMTPWVRRLLVANLLVYLLQLTVLESPGFRNVFAFTPALALARPWTFATYMFLHGGLLHLAFNLLALFFFGRAVEERMGSRAFLPFYLLGGLGGAALSFLLIQMVPINVPIVGASAAIYAVMLAFAWYWPDAPIHLIFFPAPIPAKWLITFLVALSLVVALLQLQTGVAHLAHLGGFAAGFLYLKAQDARLAGAERRLRRPAAPGVLVSSNRRAAQGSRPRPPTTPRAHDAAQEQIDRVLDKILASGMQSLTPAERKFLIDVSRKLRDRE